MLLHSLSISHIKRCEICYRKGTISKRDGIIHHIKGRNAKFLVQGVNGYLIILASHFPQRHLGQCFQIRSEGPRFKFLLCYGNLLGNLGLVTHVQPNLLHSAAVKIKYRCREQCKPTGVSTWGKK